jgi:hypothetical protein
MYQPAANNHWAAGFNLPALRSLVVQNRIKDPWDLFRWNWGVSLNSSIFCVRLRRTQVDTCFQ